MSSTTRAPVTIGTLSAITLVSPDPASSLAFYERVLDAKLVFRDADSAAVRVPGVGPLLNLLRPSAAEELFASSLSSTSHQHHHHDSDADADAGGGEERKGAQEKGQKQTMMMTLATANLEVAMAALQSRGLARFTTGPETKPWGVRTVTFEDPAGHTWEVAQEVVIVEKGTEGVDK
ncbi:hypothetical protein JDV02_003211 [Purpureocillium takamizusanense]|uniref:VOC domain-containing protein n=1 Tax=Purpureocillium takamizusanense TaxID=2060973 RepID=A0A9Q8QCR8_9HYPO|nr:uncharacterized protein JDV02_003211 [Purpureocillium takamizusanense]UNI16811.1 hypothetical protein JDV02_003211 [Purpureocillium takamizusanense]